MENITLSDSVKSNLYPQKITPYYNHIQISPISSGDDRIFMLPNTKERAANFSKSFFRFTLTTVKTADYNAFVKTNKYPFKNFVFTSNGIPILQFDDVGPLMSYQVVYNKKKNNISSLVEVYGDNAIPTLRDTEDKACHHMTNCLDTDNTSSKIMFTNKLIQYFVVPLDFIPGIFELNKLMTLANESTIRVNVAQTNGYMAEERKTAAGTVAKACSSTVSDMQLYLAVNDNVNLQQMLLMNINKQPKIDYYYKNIINRNYSTNATGTTSITEILPLNSGEYLRKIIVIFDNNMDINAGLMLGHRTAYIADAALAVLPVNCGFYLMSLVTSLSFSLNSKEFFNKTSTTGLYKFMEKAKDGNIQLCKYFTSFVYSFSDDDNDDYIPCGYPIDNFGTSVSMSITSTVAAGTTTTYRLVFEIAKKITQTDTGLYVF